MVDFNTFEDYFERYYSNMNEELYKEVFNKKLYSWIHHIERGECGQKHKKIYASKGIYEKDLYIECYHCGWGIFENKFLYDNPIERYKLLIEETFKDDDENKIVWKLNIPDGLEMLI